MLHGRSKTLTSSNAQNVLPDYLTSGLKVVFVGSGASDVSASCGHYYANRGNSFWTLIHEAGLTDRCLSPIEDYSVLEYGLGLTDIVKSRHSGDDSKLLSIPLKKEARILENKIKAYSPYVICFTSKNAYKAFSNHEAKSFGQQSEKIGSSKIFVTPSPSGRVPSKKMFNGKTRSQWYKELASFVNNYKYFGLSSLVVTSKNLKNIFQIRRAYVLKTLNTEQGL